MDNDNTYTSPTISYLGEDVMGSEPFALPHVVVAAAAVALTVAAVTIATQYARAFSVVS